MGTTKIEWADLSLNPIVGCTKISSGCKNCFAEKMAWRLKCMGNPKYQDVVDRNGWTGEMASNLDQFHSLPKKPKKVFVVSMGDLFHENVQNGSIAMVFYAMRDYPQHTYMILTKRPNRMAYFLERKISPNCIKAIPNLWLGVTVEHPDYLWRVEKLLQIPAAVRFVSVEPMLEPINLGWRNNGKHGGLKVIKFTDNAYWRCGITHQKLLPVAKAGEWVKWQASGDHLPEIDWVIAGPETGPGKRECKPEWIRNLYEQCQRAGVPFFDKTKKNWIAREFPK